MTSVLLIIGVGIGVTLLAFGGIGYLETTDTYDGETPTVDENEDSSAVNSGGGTLQLQLWGSSEDERQTGVLAGTVSYDGPVPNATVTITDLSHPNVSVSDLDRTKVRTDSNGTYQFSKVPVGNVTVAVNEDGFDSLERTETVSAGQETELDFELSLDLPDSDNGSTDDEQQDGEDSDNGADDEDRDDDSNNIDDGNAGDDTGGNGGNNIDDGNTGDDTGGNGGNNTDDGNTGDDTGGNGGNNTDDGNTGDDNGTDTGNGVTAVINATTTTPEVGDDVTLTTANSSSENGKLVAAEWNASPGSSARLSPDEEVSIEREEAIDVTVNMTIEDETGATDTASVVISFEEEAEDDDDDDGLLPRGTPGNGNPGGDD
jgi:hypothetical protein